MRFQIYQGFCGQGLKQDQELYFLPLIKFDNWLWLCDSDVRTEMDISPETLVYPQSGDGGLCVMEVFVSTQ